MTATQIGCARDDCCQRRPDSGEDALEAAARIVVMGMLERAIEAPRPSGDFLARTHNVAVAISGELRAEMERRRVAGADYVAFPDGSLRVLRDSGDDYVWVDRYRVVREPEQMTLLRFVVVGGLGVVTSRHGWWMVHSPATQPAVTP